MFAEQPRELQRRRVGPVEVLDHDHHGRRVGEGFDRLDEALGEEESLAATTAGLEHGARDAQVRSEQRARRVSSASRKPANGRSISSCRQRPNRTVTPSALAIGEDTGDAGFPGARLTDNGDAVARPLPGGQQTLAKPHEFVITPDREPPASNGPTR